MSQPSCIENVAHAIHGHTQTADYVSRYREMIQAYLARISPGWKSEALRAFVRDNPQEIDDDLAPAGSVPIPDEFDFIRKHELARIVTERRVLGCGVTTDAAVPMDKKYATLAALHEAFCKCRGLGLEFWVPTPDGWKNPYQKGATDADWDHLTEAWFFAALKDDAESLTDRDSAAIERMLNDVAEDLLGHNGKVGQGGAEAPTSSVGPSTRTKRQEKANLLRETKLKLVEKYLEDEPTLRELDYRKLSAALKCKSVSVNPAFLSRNLRNTKYDRGRARGNPHRAAAGKCEREAVAVDDPADLSELDAWTMPDDPT